MARRAITHYPIQQALINSVSIKGQVEDKLRQSEDAVFARSNTAIVGSNPT
jgi:hypothetical protein